MVAAAVVLMLFWDWNWFRPLAERKASAEFGRTITIGHFDIRDPFTATPLIVAAGIKVGNPPDFPQGSQFGAIDRVTARLDLPLWLRSWGTSVDLPEIVIDHPTGELAPGPAGNPNWVFVVRRRQDRPPAQIGAPARPELRRLAGSSRRKLRQHARGNRTARGAPAPLVRCVAADRSDK